MKTLSIITLIFLASCNPCKRIVRLSEKNPDCIEKIKETIQGDTVEFWATIEIDTSKLMDSLRLILQVKDSTGELHLSPLLRILPQAVKIEPFFERTEDYYAMAYIQDGRLHVFVETYPKEVEKFLPQPKNRFSGLSLFLLGLAIGIFIKSLYIGLKK